MNKIKSFFLVDTESGWNENYYLYVLFVKHDEKVKNKIINNIWFNSFRNITNERVECWIIIVDKCGICV